MLWSKFSDESEPSWLEPELELNNFQLDSARLVTFSIQLGIFPIKARKLALLTNFYFDWIMVKNHTFQIQKCILCYIKSNNWPWIDSTQKSDVINGRSPMCLSSYTQKIQNLTVQTAKK